MRRSLAILGMVVAVGVMYGANVWFAEAARQASAEFRFANIAWLTGVLPLLTAATAVGLGWLVLLGGRPDAIVGALYAVVGVGLTFAQPAAVWGWWTPPGSMLADLASGLMLPVWLGAAVAAIGIAELVRWARGRGRSR